MKRSSILVAIIFATIAPNAAFAQSDAGWRGVENSDSCTLEHLDESGTVLFSFDQQIDRYALRGTMIESIVPDDGVIPEISIWIGKEKIALAGPPDPNPRTNVEPPIQRIMKSTDDEGPLVLLADGNESELPRNQFAEAKNDMRECVSVKFAAKGAQEPVLLGFDGIHQLAAEASRQRMLSQKLGFTLTIDATGKSVACELSRDFRRRATEVALCRPLLKHMRFEPAIDANGNPTTGQYSSVIDFDMWMTQRGYLEPEDR